MQALRAATAISVVVAGAFGLSAQGSGGVEPVKKKAVHTHGTTAAVPAIAAAAPVSASVITVNEFMSYDSAAKTVALKVNSAHGSMNGGMNFNGGANGNATITVPQGWSVSMAFKNEDAIPHSAILLPNKQPFPAQPSDPAIPRAYTNDVTAGLSTGKTDQTTFKATPAGEYLLACGVPGHAPSGMWIHFSVSATAKAPTYATK